MAKQTRVKLNWNAENIPDQSGRRVIITGAATGLGKETARVLASKNAEVIIAARNKAKAHKAIDDIHRDFPKANVTFRQLDLADLASVKSFANGIIADFNELDVLINNAGIMMCPKATTKDGNEIQMGTNHFGHFALTGQLLPLLEKAEDSRIVILSSIAHKMSKIDLDDINWEKRKYNTNMAYYDSKLADQLFAHELNRKLADRPNAPMVTIAHPGWTATDLQRHNGLVRFLNIFFAQQPKDGVLPTLRAGFDKDTKSGDFFGPSGAFEMKGPPVKVKATKQANDLGLAKRLWTISEDLTGIHFA
ncbi:oxidoreductase [Curvivirga aplysinae]|uniref:oxidoreductase n=1 Tax=Curvivirga aplysinae TaxID=2529852 RepID=UPI0012BC4893|nr:oxidoreductase [Curvivirga aplysinae]MTI10304.1 SDR family NAD(P)-dependent oxidoreductase [Curvivirga aplysinae]